MSDLFSNIARLRAMSKEFLDQVAPHLPAEIAAKVSGITDPLVATTIIITAFTDLAQEGEHHLADPAPGHH